MAYIPKPVPQDSKQIPTYLSNELQILSNSLNDGSDFIITNKLSVSPKKPRIGMFVYADGTNWDPGSGEGLYYYNGTGWVCTGTTGTGSTAWASITGKPSTISGYGITDGATTTYVTSALVPKADLVSPALLGTPTAPTAATSNNTTQIATTAFVQSAISSYAASLYVSPFTYGAVGDGSTDDTSALQNTINAAATAGKTVFIPQGTFIVTSLSLPSNTSITGYGRTSIIKMKNSQPTNTWILKNNNFTAGNTNITLSNFALDGNMANQVLTYNNTCGQFQKVSNLQIQGLYVYGGISEGIYLYLCEGSVIVNSDFSLNGPYQADASGLHLDSCSFATVVGNRASSNGFHGIIFSSTTNSTITGNSCFHNGYEGIRMQYDSNYNTVTGNILSTNNRNGLYVLTGSSYNMISANIMTFNVANGLAFNVSVDNYVTGNQINSNDNSGIVTVDAADLQYFENNSVHSNLYLDYELANSTSVTQLTNKSTAVTLNAKTGVITTNNAALAANSVVSFTLNNSYISSIDNITLSFVGGNTTGAYHILAESFTTGACTIVLRNMTAGSLSESIQIRFSVIKNYSG